MAYCDPTGQCLNCGGLCYEGDSCCSDECAAEFAEYILREVEKEEHQQVKEKKHEISEEQKE